MTDFPTYSQATAASNPLNSRGTLLAVCAAVWAIIVIAYAQGAWLSILMLLLTDGLIAAFLALSAAALGDVLLRLMKISAAGPLRFATAAGLGLGIFSLSALGLGLAGLLSQATAIAMPLASVAVWFACVGQKEIDFKGDVTTGFREWLRAPAGWHWLFVAAMPSLAMATVGASIMPGMLWKPDDPHPYDVVSYHLQVPREWYELGRIVPLRHNMFSYFPFNVEMQFLLSMHIRGGPWAGMYLCQFMSLAFAVLAVVATYAVARMVATSAGATIAAVAVATLPWMTMLAAVAYVEPALIFYAALTVGWMVPAISRSSPSVLTVDQNPGGETGKNARPTSEDSVGWREAAVAGICAGLACGVKLTAGPMLLAPVALAVCAMSIGPGKQLARAVVWSAIFVGVGLLVLSPWLIRNAIWTGGNPFFPNATGVFGAAHFLPGQLERFAAAHSAVTKGTGNRLASVFTQIVFQWQSGFAFVPLALIGLGMALEVSRRRIAVAMAIVLLIQLVFWIGFTHLLGRFMLIGVPMAAVLVVMLDRARVTRIVAAIAVVIASCVAWIGPAATGGGLNGRLEGYAAMGRQGLFGLQDVSFVQPVELQQLYDSGAVVHFVGDAQTFLHRGKTSQLRYRSVFDVRPDTEDPVTAWTGKPLSELPDGEWVLMDPAEIHRLSTTYRHVPDVPASYPGPRDRPYLMNNKGQVVVPIR